MSGPNVHLTYHLCDKPVSAGTYLFHVGGLSLWWGGGGGLHSHMLSSHKGNIGKIVMGMCELCNPRPFWGLEIL